MPHITAKFEHGPVTYDVGTDTVIGGRLVMLEADATIKHTTLNTNKCVGVATDDARPLSGQAVDGYNVTSAIVRSQTAVAYRGVWRLEFDTAAVAGDRLVAAADGKVRPWTAGTTTFDQVIGRALENVLINNRGKVLLMLGGS